VTAKIGLGRRGGLFDTSFSRPLSGMPRIPNRI